MKVIINNKMNRFFRDFKIILLNNLCYNIVCVKEG